MRIGYSISTSEIVSAEHAEYGDCAKFQITCPHCREAVFKTVRRSTGEAELHFFSHYKAASEDARLCEMRVAAIAMARASPAISEPHGQTLKQFMATMRDSVIDAQDKLGIIDKSFLRKRINQIIAHTEEDILERPVKICLNATLTAIGDNRETIAKAISERPAFQQRSLFWRRRQASYILDVFTHLNNEQSASQLRFIGACCYAMIKERPKIYTYVDAKCRTIVDAINAGFPHSKVRKLVCSAKDDVYEGPSNAKAPKKSEPLADILSMTGKRPSLPIGRDALMSSAGGAPFYDFIKIPDEKIKLALERAGHSLIGKRNEILSKVKTMEIGINDMSYDMGLHILAIDIYPQIIGILASIPLTS
jgi:hypothetical protein